MSQSFHPVLGSPIALAPDEDGVARVVSALVREMIPEAGGEGAFEVEARDREGYLAAFVFAEDAGLLARLDALRFEIGRRAAEYGLNVLVYPRAKTR